MTQRSKRVSRSVARLLAVGATYVLFACSDYPLPPTDCDDWCVATQRADCSDDDPADCVRACEDERALRTARTCDGPFHALTACLRASSSASFACQDGTSRPTTACPEERRTFLACMAPGGALCFDVCRRREAVCGESAGACESRCLELDPACNMAADEYHQCSLDAPLDCVGSSDQGEAAPCYDQALVLLDCVGF